MYGIYQKLKVGEGTMSRSKREYVDEKEHKEVEAAYYRLSENYNSGNAKLINIKRQLKQLIKKTPDFLGSYLFLYEILQDEGKFQQAEKVLNDAFDRALELITDEEGNWPDVLEWRWIENRHIIITIESKAVSLWKEKEIDAALELLRRLLKMNPVDKVGVRYYILAIRMNIGFEEFEEYFEIDGGYYDRGIGEWFEEYYKKFPEEFGCWEKAIEKYQ